MRREALNDLSSRDERIALGLDPVTGRAAGALASVTLDVQRVAVDDVLQPRRGTVMSIHLEHAAPWLWGSYRFDEITLDGRAYVSIGKVVLAGRTLLGSLGAADSSAVPFSKRYFLGGATTLRGWGRYLVSPLDAQGLPIGGRTQLLVSTEARFPIRSKLTGVAFVDAGTVGRATGASRSFRSASISVRA